MDAMAMPFDLRGSARTAKLTPGDRVKFRVSVKGGRSWVDRVEVVSASPVDAGLQNTPAAPVLVPVGTTMPDFELTDQDGKPVRLSALKGKVVAVTFIYSRCPLPDYCPRMVENFKAVRARFADRMNRDLVFLTISFDPRYDTPDVMTKYAASQRAGGPGWHFLTGDPAKIERVCNAFGIQYWAEEGLITHSLQTAIITVKAVWRRPSRARISRRSNWATSSELPWKRAINRRHCHIKDHYRRAMRFSVSSWTRCSRPHCSPSLV